MNLAILSIIRDAITVGSPFTATVSGDWNDGATWGNASPGVKGTDWPGLANDVATINAGVVVKYNVSEANELGAGNNNGTMWFPLNQSTKLAFGNVDFTLGATSQMITSSDGTIGNIGNVDAAFTCETTFNPAGDNTKGIIVTDGAYVDMRGDSALYGGTHGTTLFANWNAGQTFTAAGAAPLAWPINGSFTIARNTGTGVATVLKYTIAAVAPNGPNTDITINEAAPGIAFVAGGNIELENRNLMLYKAGALNPGMATVYGNRPRVDDNHVTGTVKWTDAQFTGFYEYNGGSLCTGGTFEFTNVVFRNGYRMASISFAIFSYCDSYSNEYDGYAVLASCTFTNCNSCHTGAGWDIVVSCVLTNCNSYGMDFDGFYGATSCIFANCNAYSIDYNSFSQLTLCDLTNCNAYNGPRNGFVQLISCGLTNCNSYNLAYAYIGITSCTFTNCTSHDNTGSGCESVLLSVFINFVSYNNAIAFATVAQCEIIEGSIGWDGAISAPNTVDFQLPSEVRARGVKAPLAGYVFADRDTPGRLGGIICDDYDQTVDAWRFYGAFSTQTKVANPAGGGFMSRDGYCVRVEPLSNISATNNARMLGGFLRSQEEGLAIELPARQCTIKVKVRPSGWVGLPTNVQLRIGLKYYAAATTAMTTVYSATAVAANDTTYTFTITVTPNRRGKAFIWGELAVYEAAGIVYFDPTVIVE